MNRHTRRALGVQRGVAAAKTAHEQLDALCPPGWATRMVVAPWAGDRSATCRACGATSSGKWAVMLLTREVPETATLLFTFATVCADCATKPETKDKLSARAFGPPAPETTP